MPYIKPLDREIYDKEINALVEKLTDGDKYTSPTVGEVNYIISSIIWNVYRKVGPSYTLGNNLIGVLECVKQEFYRRQLGPYEDAKIKENGDI
jgi:hypothetical protein